MNFYVLTLFPEMIEHGAGCSIIGRAKEQELIRVESVNIRDFTENKHHKVDDYPYGGGAGMLMQAQPVYDAWRSVEDKRKTEGLSPAARVVYLTPQGKKFDQRMACNLSKEKDIILLCGHYEGIDERVLQEIVTDYVSIGDYVLTGGELPALVLIDAVSRLVPGVLNNETSAETESFDNDLLEYPHFSRPEVWNGKSVPSVLLSGDHKKIAHWRRCQSETRTSQRRPDLFHLYEQRIMLSEKLRKKDKILYTDMTEILRRGDCHILFSDESGCIIWDERGEAYLLALFDETQAVRLIDLLPSERGVNKYVMHHPALCSQMETRFNILWVTVCRQAVYTKREPLPLSGELEFRLLDITWLDVVLEQYHMVSDRKYIEGRLNSKNIVGGFLDGKLAGFIGRHAEGSMGILEVLKEYRQRGYGTLLEAYMINRQLSRGNVPYSHILVDNAASMSLQEKCGMVFSKSEITWISAEEK